MRNLALLSIIIGAVWVSAVVAQGTPSSPSSSAHALKLSAAEQAVWEQEEAYWQSVKARDRQKYLDLWDDRFVGWPRFEKEPIGKDSITHMMSERKVLDYKLEPLSVREFRKDIVVTLYRATIRSTDAAGSNESTHASRLTHTWMKGEHGWHIIGGMSAVDQTSPLSAASPVR